MADKQSVNLLPGLSAEKVQQIVKKEKVNLSGVFFVLIIVVFSLIILGVNLWAHTQLNNAKQLRADTETQIRSLGYVAARQQTLNNKLGTYSAVSGQDYNADKVLTYLMEGAQGLATVKRVYVDSNLEFELTGTASNFANVARLWHDMSRDSDYFEYINLQDVSRVAEGGSETAGVSFSFDGKMVRENVNRLYDETLTDFDSDAGGN